jgi:hypothetical protein
MIVTFLHSKSLCVDYRLDLATNSVAICPRQNLPPTYSFQFLYSNSEIVEDPCPLNGGPGNQGRMKIKSEMGHAVIQNPISEYINVFFSAENFESGYYNFTLSDISNRIHFSEKINIPEPQIAFPIGKYPPGLYILQIEFQGYIQNHKIVVTN